MGKSLTEVTKNEKGRWERGRKTNRFNFLRKNVVLVISSFSPLHEVILDYNKKYEYQRQMRKAHRLFYTNMQNFIHLDLKKNKL